MSKRVLDQVPFLRLLARSSRIRRKRLLQFATKEELTALFEICLNIIKGNIPVNKRHLQKLKRYRDIIRELESKNVSLQKKKKLVHQQGGAVGTAIGTIASIVLPLLSRLIK